MLENKTVGSLVLAFPVFLLTVKSWSNSISFLILLLSLVLITPNFKYYFIGRGKQFWILFIILTSPFFCEMFAQMGRGQIDFPSLDGPSRFVLGGFIFIYLSQKNFSCQLPTRFLLGCLLVVFATFFSVILFKESYCNGRAATYIAEANTLPVYLTVLSGAAFFYLIDNVQQYRINPLIQAVQIVITLYVLYLSQTRTAWIAVIFLIEIILFLYFWKEKKSLLKVHIFFAVILFSCYFFLDVVHDRMNSAANSFLLFFEGQPDTSLGMRMGLILLDVELVKMYPLFGVQDGQLPPFNLLKEKIPILSKTIYMLKKLPGSHSESLAQLSRKGLPFGLATLYCLFVFPFCFFARRCFSQHIEIKSIAQAALSTVVVVLVSSFGTQVFHYKMTSTFWAIFLAIFYAAIYRIEHRDKVSNDSSMY